MDAVVSTLTVFSSSSTAPASLNKIPHDIIIMQYGYVTLIPLVIAVWVCLLVLIRMNLMSNTSIEVNVSDNKNLVSNYNFSPLPVRKGDGGGFQRGKHKYHVPKFMLELYERNKAGGNNCSRPDIVRSLIPKHAGTVNDIVIEELADNHLLIFDLPTSNAEEKFLSAELKILTLVEINSNVVSGVERLLQVSVYDDFTKDLYQLQKIHVYHLNNTWLSFNLTKPVIKILNKESDHRYLKIVISVNDFLPYYQKSDSSFKLSLMPIADDFEHDYPILLLSYTSEPDKAIGGFNRSVSRTLTRTRRSLEEDYEEETNKIWDDDSLTKMQIKKLKRMKNICRKRPLYIDFSEIEYDLWIVQPQGYEAFQCQGKCFYPVAEHLNPTKHAIVQALLHSVAPSKASRSCCVPTILDSISILYVDSSGVLTYRYAYKDMVVVECGCR